MTTRPAVADREPALHRTPMPALRGRGGLVLAGVLLTLSACSAARSVYDPTSWVYEKKDATPARLDRDMAACRKESVDRNKFAPTASQRIDRDKFNRCMQRHGYTVRIQAN